MMAWWRTLDPDDGLVENPTESSCLPACLPACRLPACCCLLLPQMWMSVSALRGLAGLTPSCARFAEEAVERFGASIR